MAEGLLALTDQNFQAEVLDSETPVLVDFWAPWCGPCLKVGPIIEELAADYSEKLKVGKIDVDANPETAVKYGVMSIPTVILFKGGEAVDTITGARAKGDYVSWIDSKI
jgi:thioredoxin 1